MQKYSSWSVTDSPYDLREEIPVVLNHPCFQYMKSMIRIRDWHRPWFGGSYWFIYMVSTTGAVCFVPYLPHSPAGTHSFSLLLPLFDQSSTGAWASLPHLLG